MPANSSETTVYSYNNSVQEAAITHLTSGGWVVSWTGHDGGQDSSYYDYGIYQQVFAADGTATGGPTLVNTTTSGEQVNVSLTGLSDGGWIAVWEDSIWDQFSGTLNGIHMQRFDSAGNKVGGEAQVAGTLESANNANIVLLDTGGWCISWSEMGKDEFGENAGWNTYTAKFDSLGNSVTGPIQVNSSPIWVYSEAQSAVLPDGGWLVVYSGYGDHSSWMDLNDIFIRRFDANGNMIARADGTGNALDEAVNTTTSDEQFDPSVTVLADGGWVVSWTSDQQDGYWNGVFQQRYSASGQKVGAEAQVNTTTEFDQRFSHVAALHDGGWVVTWTSHVDDCSSQSIYQQRFSADGNPLGTESRVSTTGSDNNHSAIDVLADGSWVITWQVWENGGAKIKQRHFSADYGSGTENDNPPPSDGTPGDTTPSDPGPDPVSIFYGTSGADILAGSKGADTLIGYHGDDVYIVNDKADNVIEARREGTDLVKADISHALAANVENLVLTGTNSINGTGNALANIITGNSAANVISGSAGNDKLYGGTGSDRLLGGTGRDLLSGGAGNDIVTGGSGGDLFVFSRGKDTVTDFRASVDGLDLREMQSINNLYNLVHNHLRVSGDDLILKAGNNRLVLQDVSVNELKHSDILYAGQHVPHQWDFAA